MLANKINKQFKLCEIHLYAIQSITYQQQWEKLAQAIEVYTSSIHSLQQIYATQNLNDQTHVHQFKQLQRLQRQVMRDIHQEQESQSYNIKTIETGLHRVKRLEKLITQGA